MRLPSLLLLPLLAAIVSAGWYPDSDKSTHDKAANTNAPLFEGAIPAAPAKKPAKGFLDYLPDFNIETILTAKPIANIISRTTGINVTEKFEVAKQQAAETGWHPDITLITDENYKELIVEEPLSLDELEERVWIIMV